MQLSKTHLETHPLGASTNPNAIINGNWQRLEEMFNQLNDGDLCRWDNANRRLVKVSNNLTATIAPTATDDSSKGYVVGSLWADTTGSVLYICISNIANAAKWVNIGTIS